LWFNRSEFAGNHHMAVFLIRLGILAAIFAPIVALMVAVWRAGPIG